MPNATARAVNTGEAAAKRIVAWERLALVACAVMAFVGRMANSTRDPDTFWHIATGKYILANGEIPQVDVFTWYGIDNQLTWTVQEWLFGILAYVIHGVGGFLAINLFAAAVVVLIFLGLYRIIMDRTGSPLLSLVLALFSSVAINMFATFRPQLITDLLIVGVLLLLERKKWAWIPLVMVLGVNLHGGNWPVYLVLIGLWTWGRDWRILAASVLAPLLNPKGLELLAYPFRTLGYDFSYLDEWVPTNLSITNVDGMLFLFTLSLLILLVDFRKVPVRDALIAAGFTALGFISIRHGVFWFIVVIPVLAPYMVERVATIGGWLKRRLAGTVVAGFTTFTYTQLLSVLIIACVAGSAGAMAIRGPGLAANGWTSDPIPYPSEPILTYLRDNGTARTYTEYNTGGYYIYNGIKPFIDSRADLFSPISNPNETLMDDYAVVARQITVEDFAEEYGLDTFVVSKGWPIEVAIRNNDRYERVLEDEYMVIYETRQ